MIRLVLIALMMTGLGAVEYALGPDSQPQAGVPKGAVTKHVLAPGKHFPGTPHNYSVYVPAQYDKTKPAAFMVFLDGSGAVGNGVRVPVVFDNLIHKKELPVMIGIFVDPGVLPAVSPNVQSRYERVFEYDSLSDRYSKFLVEELIPAVAKTHNLSKDPNERGLYGVSTGAVGALVAAWHRPDQFRRVLSFIGTFVAMKGGDGFAALIRRSEAKPIRVFLQAGKNDHIVPNQPQGTFYAGSWPVNNQVMFDALRFAGYEARFELGDEGHNMKHGAAILPDVLRWLWAGHPTPLAVKEPAALNGPGWDARGKVSSIVAAETGWEKVEEGVIESVVGRDGAVSYAKGGKLYKVGAAGAIGASAAMPTAVTSKGAVYTVDAVKKRAGLAGTAGVALEMAAPSGITVSPDDGMVVITDAGGRFAWSYQIGPDGALRNGEPFFRLEVPETGWMSGVHGAAMDTIGQVYFATALGVQVCEANGRVAAILHSPAGPLKGVAFGGAYLYVATDAGLFRRPVKVQGGVSAKLPKPPL
jgi:gluconolactonase